MSSGGGAGLPVVDTSRPIVLTLPGRVTPDDAARLCAQLRARCGGAGPADVVCDVGGLRRADLAAVDALARLALTAGRLGHRLRLRGVGPELRLLLGLAGLEEKLR